MHFPRVCTSVSLQSSPFSEVHVTGMERQGCPLPGGVVMSVPGHLLPSHARVSLKYVSENAHLNMYKYYIYPSSGHFSGLFPLAHSSDVQVAFSSFLVHVEENLTVGLSDLISPSKTCYLHIL